MINTALLLILFHPVLEIFFYINVAGHVNCQISTLAMQYKINNMVGCTASLAVHGSFLLKTDAAILYRYVLFIIIISQA